MTPRSLAASLTFALRSAAQNFWRNLTVSLAGVLTMGLILVLVGAVLLVVHHADQVLNSEEQNVSTIRIYIADGVSLASIEDFQHHLAADRRVKDTTLETKDEAQKDANNTINGISVTQIIGVIGSNPLPASINVDVWHLSDLQAINQLAVSSPIVDKNTPTTFKEDIIQKLQTIIHDIEIFGVVFTLILGFISLVIIMNTIRTAVFVRREEIEIMKLVGATDWFVRLPFILEGVLGGLIAAAVAAPILSIGYWWVISYVIPGWTSFDRSFLLVVLFLVFLCGAALGAFGSFLGIRRFLRV